MPKPLNAQFALGSVPYGAADAVPVHAVEVQHAPYLPTPHVLADLASMAIHLHTCERFYGRFPYVRSVAEAALGFVSSRLLTTVLVGAASITALCMLT